MTPSIPTVTGEVRQVLDSVEGGRRFANLVIHTGFGLDGQEVVAIYEGMAYRGLELSENKACRPYCDRRPRSVEYAPCMYSGNPKDWIE